MINSVKQFIKDILFPIFCVECGVEGEWWCAHCRTNIKIEGVFLCPVCGQKTETGKVCDLCRPMSCLDGAMALFDYEEDNPIGKLIKQFKYNFAIDIQTLFEIILPDFLPTIVKPLLGSEPVLIPVPLHPQRRRERGFNQSDILANIMFKNNIFPGALLDITSLQRIRATKKQARLSGSERRKNLNDAFGWIGNKPVPRRVILIDDVFTTGATLQECAKVLKQNGTKIIWGLTLARG